MTTTTPALLDAVTITPGVGIATFSDARLIHWSDYAIEWEHGLRFPRGYPEIGALRDMLDTGLVPEMSHYDVDRRLEQLRDDGWPIPPAWKQWDATFGEKEVFDVLLHSRVVNWPEVVVPIPGRGKRSPPWRLDFLLIGCTDPPEPDDDVEDVDAAKAWEQSVAKRVRPGGDPATWALIAVEVDGPQHDGRRDAERDRAVFEHYGVTTVRVKSEWAKHDPWAALSRVFDMTGIRSHREVSGIAPIGPLGAYHCEICRHPIYRTNPDDVRVTHGVIVTHERCAENALHFVQAVAMYDRMAARGEDWLGKPPPVESEPEPEPEPDDDGPAYF